MWTSITCTLCVLLAFDIDNRSLFVATLVSFIAALFHFLTEFLIYRTMTAANLLSPGIVAGVSIVWMSTVLLAGEDAAL